MLDRVNTMPDMWFQMENFIVFYDYKNRNNLQKNSGQLKHFKIIINIKIFKNKFNKKQDFNNFISFTYLNNIQKYTIFTIYIIQC